MYIAEIFDGAPKNEPSKVHDVGGAPEVVTEENQSQLVVLYPGRFQPFHLGHADVFRTLQAKFGRDNTYIATSNKTDGNKSPFNFTDKTIIMHAAGVPADRVLEVTNPYRLPPQFDPASTVLVVAVGAPDADRLQVDGVKKDGNPGYYKTFKTLDQCVTADKHGYVVIAAERQKVITLKGQQVDVSHGTPSRAAWNMVRNDPEGRNEYMIQMFGRADVELGRVLDKIPAAVGESLEEGIGSKLGAAALAGAMAFGGGDALAKGGGGGHVSVASHPAGGGARPSTVRPAGGAKPASASHISSPSSSHIESPSMFTSPAYAWMPGNIYHSTLSVQGRRDAEKKHRAEIDAQVDAEQRKNYHKHPKVESMATQPTRTQPIHPEEMDRLVTSVGQKAKQGPMKTVWNPATRKYRVVPASQAALEEDDMAPMTREEYNSRRKALQQIQMDPQLTRDPTLRKELIKKIAQLTMQARSAGVLPESTYAAHVQENRLYEAKAIVNTIKHLKEGIASDMVKGVKRKIAGKESPDEVKRRRYLDTVKDNMAGKNDSKSMRRLSKVTKVIDKK